MDKDPQDSNSNTKPHKRQRLVDKLRKAAQAKDRYRDVHVFIGGTGAVGGTALLQMLALYEEMMSIPARDSDKFPNPDDVPILISTGKGEDDIRDITVRLKRFVQSRHVDNKEPEPLAKDLYLTPSGVLVGFRPFELTALPGLDKIWQEKEEQRPQFVRRFLDSLGNEKSDFERLKNAIEGNLLMTTLLNQCKDSLPADRQPSRFRSVIVGIPIPSLMAYHFDYLKEAASHIEGLEDGGLQELDKTFRATLTRDLENLTSLSDFVLLAHTTAIGGMYDEEERYDEEGRKSIKKTLRLGFSHSAQDENLLDKQKEAEELAAEYAKLDIKVLITAAAIGIDEVRIRQPIPLHKEIKKKLRDEPHLFDGPEPEDPEEVGKIRFYPPLTFPLEDPTPGRVKFTRGEILRPTYSIRSGENGFFSVSNADALYRVMRVASASELGHVMATVGLFGDDKLFPWFPDNVCYYTEGDNSRQVFDLLNQPPLLQMQLSGLEPLALQELGSAKHQGELHTLSLLILLHRLRTLDIEAIQPYVDLEHFDPARFLIEHSRPLTFEDLGEDDWPIEKIAEQMQTLASAEKPEDLAKLKPSRHRGLFTLKDKAADRVFECALKALWMVPSLGSPIIYERKTDHGKQPFVRTGYFVAPLAHLVKDRTLVNDSSAIEKYLREGHEEHKTERYEKHEGVSTFEDYRDFNICAGGFVDLRAEAILCTAKNSNMSLEKKIIHCKTEKELQEKLMQLEPYSVFYTCGLVALLFRLRCLYKLLREAMAELGTVHEFRWQMPRDANGHILVVPGAVEAFRMVSEGLEKTTGTERLDGIWGYERRPSERNVNVPTITT